MPYIHNTSNQKFIFYYLRNLFGNDTTPVLFWFIFLHLRHNNITTQTLIYSQLKKVAYISVNTSVS